jgi:hypothetical protein
MNGFSGVVLFPVRQPLKRIPLQIEMLIDDVVRNRGFVLADCGGSMERRSMRIAGRLAA